MRAGVGGTAYIALRIDRGGHVVDAQVQQDNRRAVGGENQMAHWRDALSKPTLKVVREYRFHVATDKYPNLPEFSGVLPVSYRFGDGPAAYAVWNSYLPGPRAEIPWLTQKDAAEAIPPNLRAGEPHSSC